MSCGWQLNLWWHCQLGDSSGNPQLYDSSLWEVYFYENFLYLYIVFILAHQYIFLCLPAHRKNGQNHRLNNIGSVFVHKHFSSQDQILFTNSESRYILSVYAKLGLSALNVPSGKILKTTVEAKYNHLHSKDRRTETDSKLSFLFVCFNPNGLINQIIQLVFFKKT